ncbi:MAG TPA: hypothetical protein VK395_11430, partial [Gemmataceae bacterium]|nr:hypothetical protein [Gemmataceae bacterium]
MVQAARSGKQNIVEGSKASGTSKEMEIKLMNVARASLEELLVDYRDFLRVRDLGLWAKFVFRRFLSVGGVNWCRLLCRFWADLGRSKHKIARARKPTHGTYSL